MANEYYIYVDKGNQVKGPLTIDEIASMVKKGELKRFTKICTPTSVWQPLAVYPELDALFDAVDQDPKNMQFEIRCSDNIVMGPVDYDTLMQLVSQKGITPNDEISTDSKNWFPAYLSPYTKKHFSQANEAISFQSEPRPAAKTKPAPRPAPQSVHRARAPKEDVFIPVPHKQEKESEPPLRDNEYHELTTILEKQDNADHYTILGVGPTAQTREIHKAFLMLAKRFHPHSAIKDSNPQKQRLKEKIFTYISEAYSILSNDAKRQEYDLSLKMGDSKQVDIHDILRAEELFKLGVRLFNAQRHAEAEHRFKEAISLYPDEPEYRAYYGYVKYLLADNNKKQRDEGIDQLYKSIKERPKMASGHLFLGHIFKRENRMQEAEKKYRKSLELDPTSIEAKRELRFISMKKQKK